MTIETATRPFETMQRRKVLLFHGLGDSRSCRMETSTCDLGPLSGKSEMGRKPKVGFVEGARRKRPEQGPEAARMSLLEPSPVGPAVALRLGISGPLSGIEAAGRRGGDWVVVLSVQPQLVSAGAQVA